MMASEPDDRQSISIDIYARDQALVRETRLIDLGKGVTTVDFHNIADGIYGHTATVRPKTDDDAINTLSLSYHYDLVNQEKMLGHFRGRWFSFEADDQVYEGYLLKYDDDHLFLQPEKDDSMVRVIDRGKLEDMFYPSVPEGLALEPTLRWQVETGKKLKNVSVELSYLTGDISWTCDYRGEFFDGDSLVLAGYFTLDNELPIAFPQAKIALVAGQTHRSSDPINDTGAGADPGKKGGRTRLGRFFEYYRYPLERPVDLIGDQTIQLPFFKERTFAVERRYIVPHLLNEDQVRIRLLFDNNSVSGDDIPLPEGDIGLYRRVDDGSLVFVGEDYIPDTPVGSRVEIDVGTAFDLSARRVRIAQVRPQRNRHEETWRVELSNGRNQTALFHVEHRVFGYYEVVNAEADGQPVNYTSEAADMLVFPVNVPAGSKNTLTFSLRYGY